MMIKIELSDDECKALLQLIDLATQARGLAVAEAAVILSKKIISAQRLDEMNGALKEAAE